MAPMPATVDEAKLQAFLGKVVADFGTALSVSLVGIGDRLGLYQAMAGAGPLTAAEVAARSGTNPRYVRDWLVNQAASGYVTYDAATGRYILPPEHATALTDETSPAYVAGVFQMTAALVKADTRIAAAFRDGSGLRWGEHDPELYPGVERFFRPGYLANIVPNWIPALEGVAATLTAGATVADIGCGHGLSTVILAQAYPRSRFHGFDTHAPSIARAREVAAEAGVADRVTFAVASATDYPGDAFALIAYFDSFHHLGDPVAAARHAHRALAPDGTLLLVEPMAGERVEENLNPVGAAYAAASVLCCTPDAVAGGASAETALGAIAPDSHLRALVTAGGFTRFRRATETPFNRVFEARP